MTTGRVIQRDDPLPRRRGASEHVSDLESNAVTGAGGFGHEDLAPRQPVDVPAEDLFLAQPGFRRFDVIGEQVRGQHVMPVLLQPFADNATRAHAPSVAANCTGEIDLHGIGIVPGNG